MSGKRVMVCSWMLAEESPHVRWLREQGCEVSFRYPAPGRPRSEADMIELLPGVAATIASIEPYTRNVLAHAEALKIIARVGVGYDAIDVAAATDHGVAVTTTPGTNHKAVADYAFGLILAVMRAIPANIANVQAGRWERIVGRDIDGATLGIIGTGLIGKCVARRARGFDMRILAYDVAPDQALAAEVGVEYRPLDEVLAAADVVTLHTPLFAETRHLINAERLARMRRGAYLVNTSRGGVIDEVALRQALLDGHLAGAALDVFEQEPPWESPLLAAPNLIVSPHVAGISVESQEAMLAMACRSIVQRLNGERPEGCVNPAVIGR